MKEKPANYAQLAEFNDGKVFVSICLNMSMYVYVFVCILV